MKAEEIKNKISQQLKAKFLSKGFDYKKSSNLFIRKISGYTHYFYIDQLAWSDHYSVNVRLYISVKQVEDFLEKILGKQRNRFTLGGDIGKIKFSPDGKTVVNKSIGIIIMFEKDVDAAAETLASYFDDIALPFFDQYSNLKAVDEILNSAPFDNVPAYASGNFDTRCMKGLIVAMLVANLEYDNLVKVYDKEMATTFQDFRQDAMKTFVVVKDYLAL
jgi:hypothetical protein